MNLTSSVACLHVLAWVLISLPTSVVDFTSVMFLYVITVFALDLLSDWNDFLFSWPSICFDNWVLLYLTARCFCRFCSLFLHLFSWRCSLPRECAQKKQRLDAWCENRNKNQPRSRTRSETRRIGRGVSRRLGVSAGRSRSRPCRSESAAPAMTKTILTQSEVIPAYIVVGGVSVVGFCVRPLGLGGLFAWRMLPFAAVNMRRIAAEPVEAYCGDLFVKSLLIFRGNRRE